MYYCLSCIQPELHSAFHIIHILGIICYVELQQSSTEKKQAELTLRECKTLDPNSNVYRSVGKVYIRSSVKKELENLEKESQKADERMEGLLKKKEVFTRQMKATESELQEITKSIRSGR